MKHLIFIFLLSLLPVGANGSVAAEDFWITLGEPAWELLRQKHPELSSVSSRQLQAQKSLSDTPTQESIFLVKISESQRDDLTQLVHDRLQHCAGFIAYDSLEEAMDFLHSQTRLITPTQPSYSIDHQASVVPMLAQMSATNIGDTIVSLSGFQNRYYNGSHGADAANWLADTWSELAGTRGDVRVEKVNRGSDAMSSVVLTIEGAELADQIVVVGAHLDSINVVDRGFSSHQDSIAPGADDDASGVAGLTEILRQLMASGFQPQRTIQLMAYSGEEFGLYGSRFIAADYADRDVDVVGVLQLDMTNYNGSKDDIYLITDYTDLSQNQFLEDLIETYLPTLNVGHSRCGYACSDHASWNLRGFAASFPFEAQFGEDNPYIHSSGDTYINSGSQAKNALKFTRLGLAYVVELGEISGEQIYFDGFESAEAVTSP